MQFTLEAVDNPQPKSPNVIVLNGNPEGRFARGKISEEDFKKCKNCYEKKNCVAFNQTLRKLEIKNMNTKLIKVFLQLAISIGFLSAVADRFGIWSKEVSVWGNWDSFLSYTQMINPWIPNSLIPTIGLLVTIAEIVFAIFLIIGFKTELFAKLSGFLLLLFAVSMTFSTGVKGALDFSVFSASAGAFALSLMKEKYLELDNLISKPINS